MLLGLFRPQRPGDVATMAELVIRCHKRDPALPLELAADLPVQRLLVGLDGQEEVGSLLLELSKKRLLGVQGICLDKHSVQIQLTEKLPQHRLLGFSPVA